MVDRRSTGDLVSNTWASTRLKLGLGVGSTDTVTAKLRPPCSQFTLVSPMPGICRTGAP